MPAATASPATRFTPGGRRQRWSFDMAIELLDKKLRAMGARTSVPVPKEKAGE